ncbi:MAG: carbon-nitrogen family hydrolase [Verrucomicrobiales bacterium]|nr:carbon-nitrogen family hydrolase [Verrucomicrobiales bacterium]
MKTTTNGLQVVGVQMDPVWEDAAASGARAAALLDAAPPPRGSLVVLPEMFTTGFTMNTAVAEGPGGPGERWLSTMASRYGVWTMGGLARRSEEAVCANEALVCEPSGARVAVYRKQRPFTPGGEAQYYPGGDQECLVEIAGVRVAVFLCYDLRFPELFRRAARQRPQLFVVMASWPDTRIQHWTALLRARAIENQAYVLGVNRVGDDPTHRHNGHSLVVNPWGDVVADAGEAPGLVTANLDLVALASYRDKLPFLADLR